MYMYKRVGGLFLLLFTTIILLRWINSIPEMGWAMDIISIEEINGVGGGGGICCPKMYDVEGKGHVVCRGHVLEPSSAPLYVLRQSIVESLPLDTSGCPLYPDATSPEYVDDQIKFIPLNVSFSLHSPDQGIRIGQSALLKVQAVVERKFSLTNFLIRQPTSGKIEVQFEVDAPNFEIKPTGMTKSFFLSALQPIEYAWVLAPKRDTWGIQYIAVGIYVGSREDRVQIPFGLQVEVKPEPGPSPTLIKYGKLVGSAVTIMTSFMLAIKTLLEIIEKERKKSQQKRRKRR